MSINTVSPTWNSEVALRVKGDIPIANDSSVYGKSVLFDGNGDYLSIASNSRYDITGDFTIEAWIKQTSTTGVQEIISRQGTVGGDGLFQFRLNAGYLEFVYVINGSSTIQQITNDSPLTVSTWYHVAVSRSGTSCKLFVNGVNTKTGTVTGNATSTTRPLIIGALNDFTPSTYFFGYISNVRFIRGTALYTSDFSVSTSPLTALPNTAILTCQGGSFVDYSSANATISVLGNTVLSDDSPFTNPHLASWEKFKNLVDKSTKSGSSYNSRTVVSTYSVIYTTAAAYSGGVLAPNGDIHFVPARAARGQKISIDGVVSTYSLVYTFDLADAFRGGVLAPNGDIHFVPHGSTIGQKISAEGIVSTYSLLYGVAAGAYTGGILSPTGDIHFIPHRANRGQKVSPTGVVSTYSLVYTYTSAGAYWGGVLAPNGDIHFIPHNATVGQKISLIGTVSTYSLVYTTGQVLGAYAGGVLAPNGDIHFIPFNAAVGQKISIDGSISTYSLVYTAQNAYAGGVLASDGTIYFVPHSAAVGQKISPTGVISTYSLIYTTTTAYSGGTMQPNGDIYFVPHSAIRAQEIEPSPGIPFNYAICSSPWFNKL